jgi:hypothetical protein
MTGVACWRHPSAIHVGSLFGCFDDRSRAVRHPYERGRRRSLAASTVGAGGYGMGVPRSAVNGNRCYGVKNFGSPIRRRQLSSGLPLGSSMKLATIAMAQSWRPNSSPCPEPGNMTKELCASVSVAVRPQAGGVTGSYSPPNTSVGTSLVTGSRSCGSVSVIPNARHTSCAATRSAASVIAGSARLRRARLASR